MLSSRWNDEAGISGGGYSLKNVGEMANIMVVKACEADEM